MTLPVLPREVFDEIIGQLVNDTSTLKSCSLVCRSFRRNAQKILFKSISVALAIADGDDPEPSQPTSLVLIVQQAPHLIEYVQQLHISGNYGPLNIGNDTTDLSDALATFSRKGEFPINLRSLTLGALLWHDIPSPLQEVLALLTTIPSLQDIALNLVLNCTENLVQNLPPSLKSLSLTDTTFSSIPTAQKRLPKLKSFTIFFQDLLAVGSGGLVQFTSDVVERIVDMSHVRTFQGGDCDPYTMPAIERILRSTFNSLEHLVLQFNITDPDSIEPIDLSQFPYLAHITIPLFCLSADSLPLIPPTLIWTTKTMKKISHQNVFQSLSLCLLMGPDVDIGDYDSALKEVWQEVDTICSIPQLSLSKSFREIKFGVQSTAPNCNAFLELVQNRLPRTKKANKLEITTSSCSFQLVSDENSQDGTET